MQFCDQNDLPTTSSKALVNEWNSWLLAIRDSSEIRMQQRQMGYSLVHLLDELGHPLPDRSKDLSWPMAWGWAGLEWDLSRLEVIEGYLYGWVANQLSAVLRLLPYGPNKVQGMQLQLLPRYQMLF